MSQKLFGSATKTVANPHSSREDIEKDFFATGNAAGVIAARTALVDGVVQEAYRSTLAGVLPRGLAVLAVGGFGRRELFPFSDVDILILVERGIQGDAQKEALSAFLRMLWDSALRVSQSVRGVAECCELDSQNVELSISLIDQRFLVGDETLHESLTARLPRLF